MKFYKYNYNSKTFLYNRISNEALETLIWAFASPWPENIIICGGMSSTTQWGEQKGDQKNDIHDKAKGSMFFSSKGKANMDKEMKQLYEGSRPDYHYGFLKWLGSFGQWLYNFNLCAVIYRVMSYIEYFILVT